MILTELPKPSDFRHHIKVQIRFNDIDILGHLNNTVYFSFYDTGKAYYFQAVRGSNLNWRKVDTVIANVDNAYIRPIYFGEDIEVYSRCEAIHDKSFTLLQMLYCPTTGEVKSVCRTVMVGFNPDTSESMQIPAIWREAFSDYEQKDFNAPKNV